MTGDGLKRLSRSAWPEAPSSPSDAHRLLGSGGGVGGITSGEGEKPEVRSGLLRSSVNCGGERERLQLTGEKQQSSEGRGRIQQQVMHRLAKENKKT